MARDMQEWKRLTETHRLRIENAVARYEGRKTFADKIHYKLFRFRFQFLPHYNGSVPRWRLRLRSFGKRALPDFACIGVMKGGSSDLSAYLLQHPSIVAPLSKEINPVNPLDWRPYYPTVREMERVAKEQGKSLTGYFHPVLHSLPLIENYYAVKPKAKIIIMLRNPVDRAYSQYKWELLHGLGKKKTMHCVETFSDYVNAAIHLFPTIGPPTRIPGYPVLHIGIYAQAVELWLERFGRENVYILRAEDFFKDIGSTVCDLHEFLDIPRIKPELFGILNQNPIKAPPLDPDARAKLQEFYRPWNEKLYTLIGRDMEWD